jgi:hypothetical protein
MKFFIVHSFLRLYVRFLVSSIEDLRRRETRHCLERMVVSEDYSLTDRRANQVHVAAMVVNRSKKHYAWSNLAQ